MRFCLLNGCFLFIFLMGSGGCNRAEWQRQLQMLEQSRAELEESKAIASKLDLELAEAKSNKAAAEAKFRTASEELQGARDQIAVLNERLTELEARINSAVKALDRNQK